MTGKNKKLNFPILKQIRINQEQAEKWDSKAIRNFLEGNEISKNNSLDTQILLKMIPAFIESGIKINLEEQEIERIKQLWGNN